MDRNNKFLKIIFTGVAIATLVDCSDTKKIEEDNIFDSDTKYLSLSEAKGKYYFVPSSNDTDYPNYKTFSLKKGDTIKLEIKSDSSFIFNHFYFDKMTKIDNYKGKISKNIDKKDKIHIVFPKKALFDLQGFLLSKKDTLFFYRLNMKKYSNYEFRLFFKKSNETKK